MWAVTLGVEDFSSFYRANGEWINALLVVVLTVIFASIVNRTLGRQGDRIRAAIGRGDLTPEADTRLRFLRRLLIAAIVIFGFAIALSYFTNLGRLAASLLASGAIAAAVIGLAARQTLANVVAGVMLAITQPLRVGDWVTFEEAYGEVEDVRLNYTYLRTPNNQRVVIPNERLATGILRNDTLAIRRIDVEVSVWLPATADAGRAIDLITAETGCRASISETKPDGVCLSVAGEAVPPAERGHAEADLRTRCMLLLRAEGLLPVVA